MMSLSHAISSCCMRLTPLLLLPSLLLSSCGHRTLSWQGGSYTGEVKDGVPDGWGIYRDDSTCYRGNWSKGQRDGMGYLTTLKVLRDQEWRTELRGMRNTGEDVSE